MNGNDVEYLGPPTKAQLEPLAEQIARQKGIPVHIFKGYIDHESDWDIFARNPKSSATGLIQFLDKDAQSLGMKTGRGPDDDRYNPRLAMERGADYLLQKYEDSGRDWRKAVKSMGEGTEGYMAKVTKNILKYMGPSEAQAGQEAEVEFLGPGNQTQQAPVQQPTAEPSQQVEFMGTQAQPATAPPDTRTMGQKVAGAVAPTARPILEYGGLTLGAALATPETMGAGSVLGAGLGYASGKKAADILETYAGKKNKPQDLKETALETGKDVARGSAYFLTGEALSALTGSVAKWAGNKVAPWLYESALKIPPVSVPADVRNNVVQTGLEGKYLPNKASLERLQQESAQLARQIGGMIDRGAKKGATIDTDKVLGRVDELAEFYQRLPDPRPYMEHLEAAKNAIREYRGDKIPVDVAQDIKKTLYVNLRKSYGEMKTISKEFDKAVARGIKEELEGQFPELENMNKKLSEKINLQQVLERAVHRVRNYDVVRLGDTIAATAGAAAEGPEGLGIAYLTRKVLDSPTVKARLAIALRHAGKLTVPGLGRSATAAPYATSLYRQRLEQGEY